MAGGEGLPSQNGRGFSPRHSIPAVVPASADETHNPAGRPAALCPLLPAPLWLPTHPTPALPWAVTPNPERGCRQRGLRGTG